MNLSQAYWMLGERDAAIKEYDAVKQLDPVLAAELMAWMEGSGVQR
jgi:hypothetical protein